MEDQKASLLETLARTVKEISDISSFKCVIKKQCSDLSRRIRFLTPLLEELSEIKGGITEETVHALVTLKEALLKAKELLEFCRHGSQLYMILCKEQIKYEFNDLSVHFEQAFAKISCDKLGISEEVKEQVALVNAQFGRAKERFVPPGVELYDYLLAIYNQSYDVNSDPAVLRVICKKLEFSNVKDIKQESLAMHKVVGTKGGHLEKSTQDMSVVVKKLESFMLTESANVIASASQDCPSQVDKQNCNLCSQSLVIPDEFQCPISLEMMRNPVIICTGQTYERACIKKWLEAGNRTCPKTQQILSSNILTPNHVLYSLICNWCEANGVEPPKRSRNVCLFMAASDGSSEFIELDTLLSKLTSNNIEDQRSGTGELRLLAKQSGQNRILIVEAGAVPLLVGLLYVADSRIQEHAVTALLNLSICEDNKECIMTSEAVPGILNVLRSGSMEARENAAATFFSLSVVDEYKVTIGASGAIPELVTLFCEGTQRGKLDAATALFSLCLYQGNRGRAVRAGLVPKLLELLTEPTGEMMDEALAIMAVLASHPDGKAAIGSLNAVPTLVELIRNGSFRNRENATAVLVHLCGVDSQHLSLVTSLGVINPLLDLAENGTERGKRKAAQLLELVGNFAEHCAHSRRTIS